jgi:uncharacterized phiE125 gp8 family phage protein
MIYPDWFRRRQREVLDRYNIRVVIPPAVEPITLEMARLQLQLIPYGSPATHPLDDWLEQIGIPVARAMCEDYTGRALATQTIEMSINGFPGQCAGHWYDDGGLPLPMSPVQNVDAVIYTDGDGLEQTMDASGYIVDSFATPGAIYAAYGTTWPTAQLMRGAVRVRYRAGYSVGGESPSDEFPLPPALKGAMLMTLGHLNANREATSPVTIAEVPMGAAAMMDPWKINWSIV